MRISKKLFGGVVALALLASMVGCGDDIECGAGTVERDGVCVPAQTIVCGDGTVAVDGECVPEEDLCPTGQVWVGGECVDAVECAAGTHLVGGECVPLCGDDEVWDPNTSTCRDENGCGEGTSLVEGECVPDENLCDPGEVYVNGECVPEVGCGEGTILDTETDECVPIDPMDDVTVWEAEGQNDIFQDGDPTPFVLPTAIDQTRILGGVIDDIDEDGTPDFDTFVFAGTAGTRLQIEGTAVGAPSVGYALFALDDEGYITYWRFALPMASRNASREVVLPLSTTYMLYVGDGGNLLKFFGEELGSYYGLWDASIPGEYDGNVGYTYMVAVTPITNPAPTARAAAAFPLEIDGVLSDVPQNLFNLPEYTLTYTEIVPDSDNLDGVYWISDADYTPFRGEFQYGLHVVPAGGLLLTSDYTWAVTRDTGFTLYSEIIPAEVITISPATPVELDDEDIDPFGDNFYRFTLNAPMVLDIEADAGESDAYFIVALADANFDILFWWPYFTFFGYQFADPWYWVQMTVALEPGTYFLMVSEYTDEPQEGDTFTYDLTITAYAQNVIDTGVVSETVDSISETDLALLEAIGDEAFLTFSSAAVGDLTLTCSPDEELDVDIAVFDFFVLGKDGYYYPALESYSGLAGADEVLNWITGPQPFWVQVYAYDLTGTKDTFDIEAAIDFPDWLIPEVEPNDELDEATDLGLLTLDESLYGYGDQHYSTNDVTVDYWSFSVDNPSGVRLETHPLGADYVDTTLVLLDDGDNALAFNDDKVDTFYSLIYMDLPAGTYFAAVDNYWMEEAELYLLEALVLSEWDVCAPSWVSCATGTAVEICNPWGTGYEQFECAGDCEDGDCVAYEEAETAIGDNDDDVDAENAGDVGVGGRLTIEGYSLSDDYDIDSDWYRFELTGTAWVEITAAPIPPDMPDLEIDLYSVTMTGTTVTGSSLIDWVDSGWDGEAEFLSLDAPLHAGDYAVEVIDSGYGGAYRVSINTIAPECLMAADPVCTEGVRSYCVDYWNVPITCMGTCTTGIGCGEPTWPVVGTSTIDPEDEVELWGFAFTIIDDVDALWIEVAPHEGTAPDVATRLCQTDQLPCTGSWASAFRADDLVAGEYYLEVRSEEGTGIYDANIEKLTCEPGVQCATDAQGDYIVNYDLDCSVIGAIERCTFACTGDGDTTACDLEVEENDEAETAQDIGELVDFLHVFGTTGTADDVDWFVFTIDQPALVRFEVLPVAGGATAAQLFVHEWLDIGTSTTELFEGVADDDPLSLIDYIYLPANPGTAVEYLVQVIAEFDEANTGEYELVITADYTMENDDNDTALDAEALGDLTEFLYVNGTMGTADDVDWFSFNITGDSVARIEVLPVNGGATAAELFVHEWVKVGTSTNQLAVGTAGTDSLSLIEYLYLPVGTADSVEYLVKVVAAYDTANSGAYRLEITLDTVATMEDEGVAGNDTAKMAQDLGELTEFLYANGVIGTAGDADWFLFNISASAVVDFETIQVTGGLDDVDITVYSWDPVGTTATEIGDYDEAGMALIEYLYLPYLAGTSEYYLVKVNGLYEPAANSGAYRLEITAVTLPVECVPLSTDHACFEGDLGTLCGVDGTWEEIQTCQVPCMTYEDVDACGYVAETTESNDIAKNAQDLGALDEGLLPIEGRFVTGDTVDWFQFTLSPASTFIGDFSSENTLVGTVPYVSLTSWLYNPDATGTSAQEPALGTGTDFQYKYLLAGTTYMIRLEPAAAGTGYYRFLIDFVGTSL
ncbi:MAG: hypothetical protein JW797_02530 [Bradymonadales bacterium]|nr:hypothetical protein [Bradymonadales bacterium]